MSTALDDLFAHLPPLPSLPKVVADLIDSLGRDNVDLERIVDDLRHDPNLGARVLRMANSPFYGASRKIGAIDDAIALIGLNTLRSLVIASGVTATFTDVPHLDLHAFWRHALVVAALARRIAVRTRGRVNAEFAYTAGLMHRIGVPLIHLAFPDAAAGIARDCQDRNIGERSAIEHAALQLCHAQVGEQLALRWHFPNDIVTALRWYAEPEAATASDTARVVALAAQIALDHAQGTPEDTPGATLQASAMAALGLSPDALADDIAAVPDLEQGAASFL